MAMHPKDAPLGATPMLPPPTGAAAERAEDAFKDYLERLRTEGPTLEPPPEPPGAPVEPPAALPESFGGGRRYDLALSKLGTASPSAPPSVELPRLEAGSAPVEPPADSAAATVEGTPPFEAGELPSRPPPGAPFVRPPITRGPGVEAVSQELLESAAESAMLRTDPDGSASFDIAFSDELFDDLACEVTVADGKVIAIFRVHDDNTRRLLEAEAGRLRVRLEERGLRVAEVRVVNER